ncbi:ABC transporter ATP-binding protein [Patescibacteria group bacterium]|nr:ABC transporter ATP-binding protein [Patescibacteria group bacterium]MBU1074475.1 ABC transporter ATP-binding protein [Patescibacteria group bacterium]MBU1951945.1 ABC transporter ATP-binding protein [Patescibacteria group bacterium]
MSNIIEAKGLTRKYRDGDSTTTALDNVSIELPEKESIAIIGTSGSGKTTLLQLLGGLDYPTSGEVFVDGKSLKDFNDNELSHFRNKTIGFVFQFFHLQDYLTAKENVALPLIVSGKDSNAAYLRAEKLLEQVGLSNRINHTPKKMSGGEMQRVAIARALANKPKIIMADEPTGNLDKENAKNVLDVLDKISESGVSVLMITHDEQMSHRYQHVLHLDKGSVIQKGNK